MLAAGVLVAGAAREGLAGTDARGVVEYNLGDTAFSDPGYASKAEIAAVVHYPRHLDAGRFPLIVQLHGSWYACASPDGVGWPCPAGVRPIPSHRGYDYLGEQLAG